MTSNLDPAVVAGFGDEWTRFDYVGHSKEELRALFDQYFSVFPWETLPADAEGFDLGCGTGRWAQFVAKRVGRLHVVDPAAGALATASRNLSGHPNVVFHHAGVADLPFAESSMDFGYSLGVLHHVPDTAAGLRRAVAALKPGAPFLLYLYYALENRPLWFRAVWRATDLGRRMISRLPHGPRYVVSQLIALGVYWPLARVARVLERVGVDPSHVPLSVYRSRSIYVMRTDALDRFGTQIEQRFTKDQIEELMRGAGLRDIEFRMDSPYWCAVGRRA